MRYVPLAHNQRVEGGHPGRGAAQPGPRGPPGRRRAAPAGRARSTATSAKPTPAPTLRRPAPTGHRRLTVDRVPPGWARRGCSTGCGASSASTPRCARCWAGAGSPPTWSGCCSRWWPTGRSTRARSSPPPSGPATTSPSRAWTAMDDDQAYRAMDLLVEADAERRCRRRCSSPSPTCSTSRSTCCSSTPPAPTSNATPKTRHRARRAEAGFRRYGHSKDHRQDLPQIVIGLAVTREGIPVRVLVLAGQHQRPAILPEVSDGLRGLEARPGRHRGGPRVLLATKPGLPAPRRRALDRRGADARRHPRRRRSAVPPGPLPAGPRQPAGQGSPARRHPRACGGSSATTPTKPNATRPQRDAAVARIAAELDRIAAARPSREQPHRHAANDERGRTAKADQQADARRPRTSRPSARCVTTPPSGRWLRQTPSGRLVIDRAKVAAEAKLDGKYLLSTSRPAPDRRGRRAGLQEPARGRTRVPRPEVHPRAAPGVPPPRTPHPRPRAALLARAAADPGRRTPHRQDLAADQPRAGPAAPGHPHRARRHRRADHRPDQRAAAFLPRPAITPPPRVTALTPPDPVTPALPAWTHAGQAQDTLCQHTIPTRVPTYCGTRGTGPSSLTSSGSRPTPSTTRH